MHKNDPKNPDLYVYIDEDEAGNKFPSREDILKMSFEISRDFVQSHRYFVLANTNQKGQRAAICLTSTAYPHINKMFAELIVEGLEALRDKENLLRNKGS